jgi:hypothetical protein
MIMKALIAVIHHCGLVSRCTVTIYYTMFWCTQKEPEVEVVIKYANNRGQQQTTVNSEQTGKCPPPFSIPEFEL